ncbi:MULTISPECIES: hypothetical protein [unclassified Micromonospora]|uniref:hypothetical protein n=1 Tax=unclassified Micromonospora TaxID=2617518 RepID=UPI00363B5200
MYRDGANGLAPPGATVAAAWQSALPGVVFVGTDGGLNSVWRTTAGTWTTVLAGPAGVAAAGGGVAATSTAGMEAYYAGLDGRLWQVRFASGGLPDPWAPTAVSGAGLVPAGARLAAARFVNGPSSVFLAGADGSIRVVTDRPAAGWSRRPRRPGWPGRAARWPSPPPPPPPWYGDTFTLPTVNPIQYATEVAVTLYR